MLLGDGIRLPVTWLFLISHNKVSNVANIFGQNHWQIKVEELLLHCNWPEMGKSSNFTYLPTLIAWPLVPGLGRGDSSMYPYQHTPMIPYGKSLL